MIVSGSGQDEDIIRQFHMVLNIGAPPIQVHAVIRALGRIKQEVGKLRVDRVQRIVIGRSPDSCSVYVALIVQVLKVSPDQERVLDICGSDVSGQNSARVVTLRRGGGQQLWEGGNFEGRVVCVCRREKLKMVE